MSDKQALMDRFLAFYEQFGRIPRDAGEFATYLGDAHPDFSKDFGALTDIEAFIWDKYFEKALVTSQSDPSFESYSCREIYLSLLYSLIGVLNEQPSMNKAMLSMSSNLPSAPKELNDMKSSAIAFFDELIQAGQATGEIADRAFVNSQYKKWCWMGMLFIVTFWKNDDSVDNEATDVAIDKIAHLLFDMLNPNAMDSSMEFFSFLFKQGFK